MDVNKYGNEKGKNDQQCAKHNHTIRIPFRTSRRVKLCDEIDNTLIKSENDTLLMLEEASSNPNTIKKEKLMK